MLFGIFFIAFSSTIADTCTGHLDLPSFYSKGDRVMVDKSQAMASGSYHTFANGGKSWVKFTPEVGTAQTQVHLIARGTSIILAYYESIPGESKELVEPSWIYQVSGTGVENCVKVLTKYVTNSSGWFTIQSHYGSN